MEVRVWMSRMSCGSSCLEVRVWNTCCRRGNSCLEAHVGSSCLDELWKFVSASSCLDAMLRGPWASLAHSGRLWLGHRCRTSRVFCKGHRVCFRTKVQTLTPYHPKTYERIVVKFQPNHTLSQRYSFIQATKPSFSSLGSPFLSTKIRIHFHINCNKQRTTPSTAASLAA